MTFQDTNISDATMLSTNPTEVPFDSTTRTTPMHPSLPTFRVTPTTDDKVHLINPVTNQPFTHAELESLNLKALIEEHPDPESASKARDEAIEELKRHVDGQERKRAEVEREMKEAENTRKLERKIFESMRKKDDEGL